MEAGNLELDPVVEMMEESIIAVVGANSDMVCRFKLFL